MTYLSDQEAMQRAIALSENARLLAPPNPWVGCVLVKDGKMIGEGFTQIPGKEHAEVQAIKKAGHQTEGATAYVTLEPCAHFGRTPPCADALIQAKVKRVVIGLKDPDPRVSGKGIEKLRNAGIEVETDLLADQISQSLAPYLHHRKTGRPFCILKAAVSLDGRTAAEDGSSQWLSGPEARVHVHRQRAESQAVLVGAGTALQDHPKLNVRHVNPLPPQQPLRVLLDSRGRIPAEGPLFDPSIAKTWIFTTDQCSEKAIQKWQAAQAEVTIVPTSSQGKGVDLISVLDHLGKKGILQLLIEGGSTLYESFLRENLADQLSLYVAPKILGSTGHPLFGSWHIHTLAEAPSFHLVKSQILGNTCYLEYKRKVTRENEEV